MESSISTILKLMKICRASSIMRNMKQVMKFIISFSDIISHKLSLVSPMGLTYDVEADMPMGLSNDVEALRFVYFA